MKVRAMRVRARASKMQRASDVSLWQLLRSIVADAHGQQLEAPIVVEYER